MRSYQKSYSPCRWEWFFKGFTKYQHQYPFIVCRMLFRVKIRSLWSQRVRKEFPFHQLCMWAEDRWLVHFPHLWKWCPCNGATRGDGSVGEDITENLKAGQRIFLWCYQSQWTLQFEVSATCAGFLWSGQSDASRKRRAGGLLIRGMLLRSASPIGYENRGQAKSLTFLYQEVSPTDQSSEEGVLKISQLGFVVNQSECWLRIWANLGLYQK